MNVTFGFTVSWIEMHNGRRHDFGTPYHCKSAGEAHVLRSRFLDGIGIPEGATDVDVSDVYRRPPELEEAEATPEGRTAMGDVLAMFAAMPERAHWHGGPDPWRTCGGINPRLRANRGDAA